MAAMFQCLARGITPGPLATFPGWQDKGRCVKKGEKAVRLCMPITCKRKDEKADGESEEHVFTRFTWKPRWFVLSQTQGDDYTPEATIPTWDRARALTTLGVTEETFKHTNGNVQGYAHDKAIAISPLAALPVKTTFHELAHVVLGHTTEGQLSDSDVTPRDEREMEAEGAAYILGQLLGLPGAAESRGYLQHWAHGKTFSERMAARIFSAANKILVAGQEPKALNT
jgi:hypothetical protein